MVALLDGAETELLALGEHRLALADADGRDAALGVDPLDGGGGDFSEPVLELLERLSLLSRADSLADDVPRGGYGDPAELLGVERHFDLVADLVFPSLVDLRRFLEVNLIAGVEHLVNNGLLDFYLDGVFLGVSLENHVLVAVKIVLAGDFDGLLDLCQHIFH